MPARCLILRHPRRLIYPNFVPRTSIPSISRCYAIASNRRYSAISAAVTKTPDNNYANFDTGALQYTSTQPLPRKHIDVFTQHRMYPSTYWQENIALMAACLAQGYVERAQLILQRITMQVDKHNAGLSSDNSGQVLRMEEVIPLHIYRDFFRSYFKLAIVDLSTGETTKWMYHASNLLDILLRDSFNYGEPNNSIYAVWLKGLVSAKYFTRRSNKEFSLLEITRLLMSKGAGLIPVLKDPIFDSELSGGLGLLTATDVLDAIEETSRKENDVEILEAVMRARIQFQEEQVLESPIVNYIETECMRDPLEGVATITPTRKPLKRNGKNTSAEEPEYIAPKSLKALLESLSPISNERGKNDIIRQEILEHTAIEATKAEGLLDFEKIEEMGLAHEKFIRNKYMQEQIHEWIDKISERIEKDIKESQEAFEKPEVMGGRFYAFSTMTNGRDHKLPELIFTSMPPKVLAYLTISVAVQNVLTHPGQGMKITRAAKLIGTEVQTEYRARYLRETIGKEFDKRLVTARLTNASKSHRIARRAFHQEMFRYKTELEDLPTWTEAQRVRLGAKLLKILLEETFISRKAYSNGQLIAQSKQPAFYHQFHYMKGKKMGLLRGNDILGEKFGIENMMQFLNPRQLPMVVEPLPWTAYNKGGYRNTRNTVMRVSGGLEQLVALRLADKNHQLYDIYDSLNALGKTSWAINKPVFDVVADVWNSGEKFLDIVPAASEGSKDIQMPDYLKDDPSHPQYMPTYEFLIKEKAAKEREEHSERCTTNYKLEIARAFIGEKFYFPQSLDFRGRAYPISTIFSHVGDDLCRGLLKFHETKPLGKNGLDWLLAQVGSLQGLSKSSYKERIMYTRDNMENVYDSADQPLKGKRWWTKADDPWQCLAACFEVANAMRSEEPEEYECSLPIHMDGTCNGLQHYAALGGDYQGATQVNLVPGRKPADIYSKIASMVSDAVDIDANNGVPEAEKLKGYVTRKVVKQPVMTTVYGVTFMGARDQILKQLHDITPYTGSENSQLALYLTSKVIESIGNLFEGATKIQQWLVTLASMVTSSVQEQFAIEKESKNLPKWKECLTTAMTWTSPMGLPIVQPYRVVGSSQVQTALQSMYLQDPSSPGQVDRRGQATAFPPNYIHSLDASHMMMTATECNIRGITFASVHDSFWTHASDVDEMGAVLREQFVKLHKEDLLGSIYRETLNRFGDQLVPIRRKNRTQDNKIFYAGVVHVPSFKDKIKREKLEKEYLTSAGITLKRTNEIPTPAGFVRLADILPPVPLRGEFDVDIVKASPYFFS